MSGVLLFFVPLMIGGVVQGMKLNNPNIAFLDATEATPGLLPVQHHRPAVDSGGQFLFALNIFG